MSGIRAFIAVGPQFGPVVVLLTGAVLLRLLSAIKVLSNLSKQEDSFILRLRDYAMMATVEHTRKIRVIVLICGMLVVTHLLACFLGMSVVMADEKLHSWWGTHGVRLWRSNSRDLTTSLNPPLMHSC